VAQWEDLSTEEQGYVLDLMILLRPACGHLASVLYQLNLIKAYYQGPSDVDTIIGTLDANAVIPNNTGLAGALDIQKSDLSPILTALGTLISNYYSDADIQRYIAMAGVENVLSPP
jgi:hypothetical protein